MKQLTQRYLVADLELRLSKSKPSTDLELEYDQMAQWIDQARDFVTSNYLSTSKTIDSSVIMEIKGLVPYEAIETFFIDLGVIPLDIKGNRGIVYVKDSEGRYILGQSIQNKRMISKLSFAKPMFCNIVYTLTGTSLTLDGYNSVDDLQFDVGIVHSELSREKDPDDRYYLLPSTEEEIVALAEEIGLRQMNGQSYYDLNSDGIGNDI